MLIYSTHISARLNYVSGFLSEFYNCSFKITTDVQECKKEVCFINYSIEDFSNGIKITPFSLLFEQGVKPQELEVNMWNGIPCFFETNVKGEISFDIFSALFFLLSRYEEYLPHQNDNHGRYPSSASLAVQHNFIEIPVVDQWLLQFSKLIYAKFGIQLFNRKYQFVSTVDIDKAYAYKYLGFPIQQFALLRSLVKGNYGEYKAVLSRKKQDPFDRHDYFQHHHMRNGLKPIFFIQVGRRGKFDKNLSIRHLKMQALIKNLALWANVGIHPSYASHLKAAIVKSEIRKLNSLVGGKVFRSRQHYLRFTLPHTYQILGKLGITEEYSMGYADRIGFRAGTCTSFLFYDLLNEQTSALRVFPLIAMDVTMSKHMGLSISEAKDKFLEIISSVKVVEGTFISLWHNSSFCTLHGMKGWAEVFEFMLQNAKLND